MNATLPTQAILCGILYNITIHEGLVIFEQAICMYGCHARMIFERPKDCGWYLQSSSTWDRLYVEHILSAYELIKQVYGGTFDVKQEVP
jgi:hypothetical protein